MEKIAVKEHVYENGYKIIVDKGTYDTLVVDSKGNTIYRISKREIPTIIKGKVKNKQAFLMESFINNKEMYVIYDIYYITMNGCFPMIVAWTSYKVNRQIYDELYKN